MEIDGLHVAVGAGAVQRAVIRGVSLALREGEVLGLLGASGCGKTTMARAIIGLLPPGFRIAAGSIRYRSRELVGLDEREYEQVRGARISLIFQEAALALNPVLRIRYQVAEVARAHSLDWSTRRCREHADALLSEVGLDRAIGDSYPHQLSGGQRQRVVVAQALCCRPEVAIADEPTASLDTTSQAEILDLMKRLQAQRGMAMIFISHNPAVLLRVASRVAVMQDGAIVEQGELRDVFLHPKHPCTRTLLDALPAASRLGGRGMACRAE